jgi:DNA-binding NtrC family response regulator
VLLQAGEVIHARDLVIGVDEGGLSPADEAPALEISRLGEVRITMPPWGIALEDVERRLIEEALREADGNVTRAAQLLQVSRDTLRYRIRKHRLGDSEEAREEGAGDP